MNHWFHKDDKPESSDQANHFDIKRYYDYRYWCRIKYEQTIGDIRKAVSTQAGIALDKVQLFRHGKELIPEKYDAKTLLEMDLHTGFSLMGYDLTEKPVYWPPVKETNEGLQVISAIE